MASLSVCKIQHIYALKYENWHDVWTSGFWNAHFHARFWYIKQRVNHVIPLHTHIHTTVGALLGQMGLRRSWGSDDGINYYLLPSEKFRRLLRWRHNSSIKLEREREDSRSGCVRVSGLTLVFAARQPELTWFLFRSTPFRHFRPRHRQQQQQYIYIQGGGGRQSFASWGDCKLLQIAWPPLLFISPAAHF